MKAENNRNKLKEIVNKDIKVKFSGNSQGKRLLTTMNETPFESGRIEKQ